MYLARVSSLYTKYLYKPSLAHPLKTHRPLPCLTSKKLVRTLSRRTLFGLEKYDANPVCVYRIYQDLEAEQEVVETILPLARLGSSITLTDGRTSALLGEMTPAAAAAQLMERQRFVLCLVFAVCGFRPMLALGEMAPAAAAAQLMERQRLVVSCLLCVSMFFGACSRCVAVPPDRRGQQSYFCICLACCLG